MNEEQITANAEHGNAISVPPHIADHRALKAEHATWREAEDEYEAMFWAGVAERRPLYSQADLLEKGTQITILFNRFRQLSRLVCRWRRIATHAI